MTTEKNVSITPFDLSLQELAKEATEFFQLLNKVSVEIQQLEDQLIGLKFQVPFRHPVYVKSSSYKNPQESDKFMHSDAIRWRSLVYWYLAWEPEENTKKYRLFLIAEGVEEIECFCSETHQDTLDVISTGQTYKKALSETNIATRLQYGEHLIPFMNALKDKFKYYQEAIMRGEDPFLSNGSLPY